MTSGHTNARRGSLLGGNVDGPPPAPSIPRTAPEPQPGAIGVDRAAFIATFDGGLSLHILLCAISVAVGIGPLRLVRLKLPMRAAPLLAPVLTKRASRVRLVYRHWEREKNS